MPSCVSGHIPGHWTGVMGKPGVCPLLPIRLTVVLLNNSLSFSFSFNPHFSFFALLWQGRKTGKMVGMCGGKGAPHSEVCMQSLLSREPRDPTP